MIIGAQMYSVRDMAKNPIEIDAAFKRLKEIGYTAVQASGLGPITPEELRDISQKYSLPIVVTHTNTERLLKETQAVIDEHKTFGCKNIGVGYMPGNYHGSIEGFRQFAADFSPVARLIAENGMQFHYHNHDFEFAEFEGKCGFDVLIEATEKDNWHFILDTFWVEYAGKNVIEYINKLSGRLSNVHLKDMQVLDGKRTMCPVGKGTLDFSEILSAFEKAGTQYAHVEQDNASDFGNPFDQLEISYKNLSKMGWK